MAWDELLIIVLFCWLAVLNSINCFVSSCISSAMIVFEKSVISVARVEGEAAADDDMGSSANTFLRSASSSSDL